MKKKILAKMALVLALTGIMILCPITAMASTNPETPEIARTRAWDAIEHTLGGIPESVRKIEYQNSIFYLAPNVTDDDFTAVITKGAEAVNLKPPQENGKLYQYPVYIIWNSEKTVLLVHPIMFAYDDVLEAVAIPTEPPTSLTGAAETPQTVLTPEEIALKEYTDAVRTEFYRLLNEHRVKNGLRKLEVNLELQDYADIRAAEQRLRRGHTRPDGSRAGSGWHNSSNVMNSRYAENVITVGILNADPKIAANTIFTRWKESAGHNRHMLYRFDSNIKMAFGIVPIIDELGVITSGAIFATGY